VTRDEVLVILRAHLLEIRALGVASLAIFGSFARDEARPDNDVDVLVEFTDRPTFRTYTGVLFYLGDLLGRSVDLTIRGDVKARIRSRVEQEVVRVA
jgi:predicted nucleotidyltransferase